MRTKDFVLCILTVIGWFSRGWNEIGYLDVVQISSELWDAWVARILFQLGRDGGDETHLCNKSSE